MQVEKFSENKPLIVSILLLIDSLHFVFARMLLPHIPPAASAMYVMLVATVTVGVFGLVQNRLHIRVFLKSWWFFLTIGTLVALSTNINYEAVAYIDPGTAAMLAKSSILFGIGLGVLWLKESLTRIQKIGAFIAVGGVFTITFQPAEYLRIGSLLILCSTFMYALHAALTKRFAEKMAFVDFFFFRLLSTSAILFSVALGRNALVWPTHTAWMLLILVGILDVAISRGLYYLALRRLRMSIHALVLTLSPVAAVLWSLMLFDVLPNRQQFIGGLAVMLGVFVVLTNKER